MGQSASSTSGGFAAFNPLDTHIADRVRQNKSGKLNCIYWNACGINEQFRVPDGFQKIFEKVQPDVLLMIEIKATEKTIAQVMMTLPGYKYILLPSRLGPPASRGIIIIYKEGVQFVKAGELCRETIKTENDFEAASIELRFKERSYNLICFYFANDGDISKETFFKLKQCILKNRSENSINIFCGDKNLKDTAKNYTELFGTSNDGGCPLVTVLNKDWTTNRSKTTDSTIDCIMTTPDYSEHILCHKPIEPHDEATRVHKPIFFEVGPDVNPESKSCQKSSCK